MSGVVLFGIGSSIVVEYVETCRRLGRQIALAVRNRPGPAFFADAAAIVDVAALTNVPDLPCFCPMFTPQNRRVASGEASALGLAFRGALIDPTAIVASSSSPGAGTFINAGCIVGANCEVAEHVLLNRGVTVGHHVSLGPFASLGPSAVIGGHVSIGEGAMIGAGAIVLPSVRIGANAIVAAGAVVVRDVPAGTRVMGNPARAVEPARFE